ncbi:MAG: sigma-70 family RNA polymerase sigma factor [Phycisphaerae bacterium]|nr:sigma-70 family RNA polymerase sigma factor [Phycisphaerae bacterium]
MSGALVVTGSLHQHTDMDEHERDAMVGRASAGDTGAFQCLLVYYHVALRTAVQRATTNALRMYVDADDVLQQAYIAAFEHVADQGLDSAARFYRWIEQIALNQLKDMQRAMRRKKRDVARVVSPHLDLSATCTDLFQRLAADDATPSQNIARDEAVAAVMTSLARLSTEQRDAIRLRILEDRSVAEIATALGKSEKAVYALCYRGLRALQAHLGPVRHFLTKI